MARGTQHRKRRPQTNARVAARTAGPPPKRPKRPAYEEQLFFGRLRNHAKPVFVAPGRGVRAQLRLPRRRLRLDRDQPDRLELLQRHLRDRASRSARCRSRRSSIRRAPRPGSPTRTSSSRRASGTTRRPALTTYTTLRPKDTDQLSTLAVALPSPRSGLEHGLPDAAGLHADADARLARRAEVDLAARQGPRDRDEPARERGLRPDLDDDEQRLPAGAQLPQPAPRRSTRRSAKLEPKDATTQLELAQAASDASDSATAIAAYRAFLKLAPSDSLGSDRSGSAEGAPGAEQGGVREHLDRQVTVRDGSPDAPRRAVARLRNRASGRDLSPRRACARHCRLRCHRARLGVRRRPGQGQGALHPDLRLVPHAHGRRDDGHRRARTSTTRSCPTSSRASSSRRSSTSFAARSPTPSRTPARSTRTAARPGNAAESPPRPGRQGRRRLRRQVRRRPEVRRHRRDRSRSPEQLSSRLRRPRPLPEPRRDRRPRG